jgi:formylglycine-generating enzyme required for sulfatase activity
MGKRLPTEAEFALVAGGLRSNAYAWGSDPPACGDAVFGRTSSAGCTGSGPSVPGSGRRDRVVLSGAEIVDVAGNVSEWVSDLWNRDDDPCFRGGGTLRNPRCATPSERDGLAWLVRGGSFASGPSGTRAALRLRLEYDRGETRAVNDVVGFRCARGAPG